MAGVFDGIDVLDLTWGSAGPMTTMLLADNGARVTRISPPAGDPFAGQTGYRVWNRGKRSAVLDLRSDEGRTAFEALARRADVVVDSFSIGTTERLGIDYASLAAANPRIVTCSISAYGRHPAHRDRPGIDALVMARTGLLYDQKGRVGGAYDYIMGRSGPEPDQGPPEGMRRGADRDGPVFPRTPWPSVGATYSATLGIAAALRAREVTGRGQAVETSLLHGTLAAIALNWQRVENPEAPMYWMWPIDSRSIEGIYECADGRWVHHWTVRPKWVLGAAEADSPTEVVLDTAYRADPDRIGMDAGGFLEGCFLHPLLVECFKKFPAADWIAAAENAGVGMALVRSPAESLSDPSFIADGCVASVDDPEVGRIRHVGVLLDFSATPGAVAGTTAPLGMHTADVLAEAAEPASDHPTPPPGRALAHPLEGIRVLDLGLGVAGPFTGRVLADLGADVIKVMATYDGFWAGTHMGLGTNRGKRSLAVNLKDPRALAALEKLIATADVLTVNWRPGAMARLGLDFDTLHARHPRLVYCNTRGFEKGPRSDLPGTDQTAAALVGTEWEDGGIDAGNPPIWSRSNMGDTGNAMLAAIAIVAALYRREITGEGQELSTSIVNAGLLATSYAWVHDDGSPADWGHIDAAATGMSPTYRMFRSADDRWIFVACVTDTQRAAFLDATGSDVEAAISTRDATEWFERLDRAGVPVEIVDEQFCRTLFDDPIALDLGLVAETWAPGVGRFEDPGPLASFSDTPTDVGVGPCQCGEHTRSVLRELGYSDSDIDELAAAGAILDAPVSRPA